MAILCGAWQQRGAEARRSKAPRILGKLHAGGVQSSKPLLACVVCEQFWLIIYKVCGNMFLDFILGCYSCLDVFLHASQGAHALHRSLVEQDITSRQMVQEHHAADGSSSCRLYVVWSPCWCGL